MRPSFALPVRKHVQFDTRKIGLPPQLVQLLEDHRRERESSPMAGLIDLVSSGEIPKDSTVLYAHLGWSAGAQRLLGHLRLSSIFAPTDPRWIATHDVISAELASDSRRLVLVFDH